MLQDNTLDISPFQASGGKKPSLPNINFQYRGERVINSVDLVHFVSLSLWYNILLTAFVSIQITIRTFLKKKSRKINVYLFYNLKGIITRKQKLLSPGLSTEQGKKLNFGLSILPVLKKGNRHTRECVPASPWSAEGTATASRALVLCLEWPWVPGTAQVREVVALSVGWGCCHGTANEDWIF